MKLVDMLVLGTSAEMHVGSSPTEGMWIFRVKNILEKRFFFIINKIIKIWFGYIFIYKKYKIILDSYKVALSVENLYTIFVKNKNNKNNV